MRPDRVVKRRVNLPGFTLVEILTVIAVIAVLAGLILSVALQSKLAGNRADSISNLRQLGQAAALYNDREGRYPIGTAQLVAAGNIPQTISAARSDATVEGIANRVVDQNQPASAHLHVPYKNSYVGLREYQIPQTMIDRFLIPRESGGWLIDCTDSQQVGLYDPVVWSGSYRRLQYDGAVVTKHFVYGIGIGPEGKPAPMRTPILLFVDNDEEIKQWLLSDRR